MGSSRSITMLVVSRSNQTWNAINSSPDYTNGSSSFFRKLEKKDFHFLRQNVLEAAAKKDSARNLETSRKEIIIKLEEELFH